MAAPLNTTALAFIGDAVYEVFIRKHILQSVSVNADVMHRAAVKYVSAKAQAKILKKIYGMLSEEEQNLIKRARNHKITTKPKNADPITYKYATAFEALIGYHYMAENYGRMEEILNFAVNGEKCDE